MRRLRRARRLRQAAPVLDLRRLLQAFGRRKPRSTLAAERIWVDLVDPAEPEALAAQTACGVRLPNRAELGQVESSSRHYREGGTVYLSAVLATEEAEPRLTPVGFILLPDRLITIRYDRSRAFDEAADAMRSRRVTGPVEVFVTLAEEIVDELADRLERCADDLETLSRDTFQGEGPAGGARTGQRLRATLAAVGRNGERLSKLRASLLTLGRILAYVADAEGRAAGGEVEARIASARDDLASLTHYQETLFGKTQFLLDAVLGFINIDQNDVIKILTVVSVVGVPPTLIASIYGMNFKIPELSWSFGYAYALVLIVVSAVAPLIWFKRRGWF